MTRTSKSAKLMLEICESFSSLWWSYTVLVLKNMEFPPDIWAIFPAEEFSLAQPRNPGNWARK